MANKAKFLFDTPFDGSKPRVERSYAPKPPPPKFSAEELEAAKAAAYAEGEAAGRAAAYGEHQQALEKALQGIAVKLSQLAGAEERSQLAARIEAVEVATAIARKLAGRLIERQPLDRIEALVLRCMDDMRDEPRLVVRAAEPVIQLLDQRIDQLMAQSGCRIDWADGSAERKQAVLEQDVDQAVERYVAGLQAELAQLDG
jgi:flagellar assembly protein FliH